MDCAATIYNTPFAFLSTCAKPGCSDAPICTCQGMADFYGMAGMDASCAPGSAQLWWYLHQCDGHSPSVAEYQGCTPGAFPSKAFTVVPTKCPATKYQ
jgi:hypothetical protein